MRALHPVMCIGDHLSIDIRDDPIDMADRDRPIENAFEYYGNIYSNKYTSRGSGTHFVGDVGQQSNRAAEDARASVAQ